jgi:hypothetical protein
MKGPARIVTFIFSFLRSFAAMFLRNSVAPPGLILIFGFQPTVETVGYFQTSLWEFGFLRIRAIRKRIQLLRHSFICVCGLPTP